MAPRARPRLVDVAELLSLAPSTVSRALAGSEGVSTATRERVVAAARELGYTVNPAASGLKRGQTLNIGLIAVMNHWYAGAVTSGADRVAAERGYDFVVVNSAGRRDESFLLERARRLGTRVDGALIVDVTPDGGLLERLIDAVAKPVVLMGCEAAGVSSVLVDNRAIGASAGDHLRDLGHDAATVFALANPTPWAYNNSSARAAGFSAAMGPDRPVTTTYLPPEDRAARQRAILDLTEDSTAVFCSSDALAIETVALLRQAGRDVPGRVSVIGVDDHPLAQPVGLTTVAQAPEAMGEIATARLLAEIVDGAGTHTTTVGTELVVRQTTGPADAG